jgi:hypothetical protein
MSGKSVLERLEISDIDGELWVYDPLDQDRTYAVVYYGKRALVSRQIAKDDPVLARSVQRAPAKTVAYWSSIELASKERKRGIGRAFAEGIMKQLAALGVEVVFLLAHDSSGFWRKLGFERITGGAFFMPAMARDLRKPAGMAKGSVRVRARASGRASGSSKGMTVVGGDGITAKQVAAGKAALEKEILWRGQNALDHAAARYVAVLKKVNDGWRERRYEFVLMGRGGKRATDDYGRERYTVYPKPPAARGQTPQNFYEQIPASPSLAYRGMSWEAWQHAKRTGAISSTGEMNFSGQEGLTFYTADPSTAQHYAGSFSSWHYLPAHGRPGVVVAVPRIGMLSHKDDPRRVPDSELAASGPIPVQKVAGLWYLVPYEVMDGELDIVEDEISGKVSEGSRRSPSSYAVVVPARR